MPSKKANSFIFMAVATVLNILLLIVLFALGILLLSFLPDDNPNVMMLGIPLVFLGSIGLSFVIYAKVLAWAIKKFNLESKMDPLFSPKRRKPRKED